MVQSKDAISRGVTRKHDKVEEALRNINWPMCRENESSTYLVQCEVKLVLDVSQDLIAVLINHLI